MSSLFCKKTHVFVTLTFFDGIIAKKRIPSFFSIRFPSFFATKVLQKCGEGTKKSTKRTSFCLWALSIALRPNFVMLIFKKLTKNTDIILMTDSSNRRILFYLRVSSKIDSRCHLPEEVLQFLNLLPGNSLTWATV